MKVTKSYVSPAPPKSYLKITIFSLSNCYNTKKACDDKIKLRESIIHVVFLKQNIFEILGENQTHLPNSRQELFFCAVIFNSFKW